jgi:hypothetical protein
MKGDCLLATTPMQDAAMHNISHPSFIVSRLLRPLLWRQQATMQFRKVERIGDANVMYSAIVIGNAEFERSFAKDCLPIIYPIDFAHIRENQVVEQMGGVGHAVRGMIVDANWK